MPAGSLPRPGNWPLVLAICLAAALLAGSASALMLRNGIKLTPDSWSYWEGSVSLLNGRGYYEFSGRRVWSWPPGYSFYLAAWQRQLGVSGRTLARANIALAAIAAFAWTAAFMAPYRQSLRSGSWCNRLLLLAVIIFIAMTLAMGFRAVMAHNLAYTLFPFVLLVTCAMVASDRSPAAFVALTLLNMFVLSLLTATHYSFVFFPLVVAAIILPLRRQRTGLRCLSAALLALIPLAIWWAVRWKLGTLASHKPGARPRFGWGAYAGQAIGGIGNLLAPDRRHLGQVLLAAVCVILLAGLAATRRLGGPGRRAMLAYVQLSCGFLLCLYVVFNRTYIIETLYSDRFLLFVPLTLFPAAAMLVRQCKANPDERPSSIEPATPTGSGAFLSRAPAIVAAIVLIAIAVTAAVRAVGAIRGASVTDGPLTLSRAGKDQGFAYNRMTLDWRYAEGPPKDAGNLILVSPGRDFEKHERK